MLLFAAALSTGCASVMNDSTHPLRIEAKTSNGEFVAGAQCTIAGEYGTTNAKSGDTVVLRRGSQDLDVSCKDPSQPEAKGRLVSRANSGMLGNIILGGVVGAIVDHSKGTGYTYPTWIQLIFGKTLVFDRSDEESGKPVVGQDPANPRPQKKDERITNESMQRS